MQRENGDLHAETQRDRPADPVGGFVAEAFFRSHGHAVGWTAGAGPGTEGRAVRRSRPAPRRDGSPGPPSSRKPVGRSVAAR